MQKDLFSNEPRQANIQQISENAYLLPAYAHEQAEDLVREIENLAKQAPFRQMLTPGGKKMSVAITNCGQWGWISDTQAYRYSQTDPLSDENNRRWPSMPERFALLATAVANKVGFANFNPNACLINRYSTQAKMGLHQDRDEDDFSQPIVSVSLGLSATFLFGGLSRKDKYQRIPLQHGDVFVWGGDDRLRFHGIQRIDPDKQGHHPLTGAARYNLTFRHAR